MPSKQPNQTRRRILQTIGVTGGLSAVPFATAVESAPTRDAIAEKQLRSVALEVAAHPTESAIAFTAITEDAGLQLYLARGADSLRSRPTDEELVQLTDADAGVHGLRWVRNQWLMYSVDGQTVVRKLHVWKTDIKAVVGKKRTVSNEPLPIRQRRSEGPAPETTSVPDVPYPIDCKDGANVCCTDIPFVNDWCIRVDYDENPGHSPRCDGATVPRMDHAHIAIYPSGDAEGGINIWSGYDGRCVWIGEENHLNKCTKVCGSSPGEMPSVGDLRDAFEDMIEDALDAAGIAAPAVVVVAIAYFLAVTTVTPPVPGVPVI